MLESDGTPAPPYYAVIFSSLRNASDPGGYAAAAERMLDLARLQPGFLGVESARGEDGTGITVSYWDSREAIERWRDHGEHLTIQSKGRSLWYDQFELRVARVEDARRFRVPRSAAATTLRGDSAPKQPGNPPSAVTKGPG